VSPSRDERLRELERRVAASPGDASAELALARELSRAGKKDAVSERVEGVLARDPLSRSGVEALDELGLSPLARLAPWPTVHGGNDRARRSSHPGARKGRLARRLRVGAPAGMLGNGDLEHALSLTVGGNGTAYLATNHRRLIALDLASGQPRWIRAFEHAFAAPSVGAGERLALQMLDSVRLLDGRTGETLWIARAPGVTGDPVPANATFAPRGWILCPGLRGVLYALDSVSGKLRWSFATRGAQYAAPVVDGDRIFVVCSFGELAMLDLEGRVSGKVEVKHPGGVLPLMVMVSESHVYVTRLHGNLGAVVSIERTRAGFGEIALAKAPWLVTASVLGATDSGLCMFVGSPGDDDISWFDSTGTVVKTIRGVDAGPLAIGPDSTVLVASSELGILQVVE
jgi:hypothetical protein